MKKENRKISLLELQILSCPLCCARIIGTAILNQPKGKVQGKRKILEMFLLALKIRSASPISAGHDTALIILSAGYTLRHYFWCYIATTTSPIIPKLAYNLGSTDQEWKLAK